MADRSTVKGGVAQDDVDIGRRRFVQVCVGVASAAAVGSTLSSFLGLRSPLEIPPGPAGREAVAICPVCSVGCGLRSVTSSGEAAPSNGDPQSRSTSGMVCGRGALPPATMWPSVLDVPLQRKSPATKGTPPVREQFQAVTWDEALERVIAVLVETGLFYGPASRGCILGNDVAMEDSYVAGKLWKGVLSSPSIDAVESIHSRATEQAFMDHLGQAAPPTCYDDIALADMIVVLGEDLASTHPVLYARVVEAVAGRGANLVVIDPRFTATAARTSCLHVPVRAGGEAALLNSVGYVLVHEMGVAPSPTSIDHAENALAYAEFLKLYNPAYDENERVDADHLGALCTGPSEWVSGLGNRDASGYLKSFDVPTVTGLDPERVRELAKRWSLARNVVTIWSSRVAGAGDGGAAASTAINLHLLTGQVGRPGAGPMGLHAHALGRGAFDLGACPSVLPGAVPGGTGVPTPALEEAWGAEYAAEAARLPPGKGVVDILGRAKQGDVRVLLLLGGSVSAEVPDTGNLVDPALRSSFVISTAAHLDDPDVAYADLVLPRPSWYEREAYFVSSQRTVGRSLPSLAPVAGPLPEWAILSRIGAGVVGGPLFDFGSSTQIVDEARRATLDAPADLRELPVGAALTDARGVQWPVVTERSASTGGTPRRYMGQDGSLPGFPTASGKANILPRQDPTFDRTTSPDYPLTAITSVDGAVWWDGTFYLPRGGDVARPRRLEQAYVEMGGEDALALGLAEGDLALVTSTQGSITLPVRLALEGGAPGHVFIPWGADVATQALAPSFPMDGSGVPPWSAFPVRVERSVVP